MLAKILRSHTTGKLFALIVGVWGLRTQKMLRTVINAAETGLLCNVMRSLLDSSKISKSNARSAMVKDKRSPQNATYAKAQN
jgi:hypothetical protein